MLISFKELQSKHNLAPKAILHAGAHLLEERESYLASGARIILWVEGNPALESRIRDIIASSGAPECEECAALGLLDDVGGKKVIFHVGENTQTSSLLEFGTHTEEVPENTHNEAIETETVRLDQLIDRHGLAGVGFDFLNVDVQGVELRVIRGLGTFLPGIKWIYTEINIRDTYRGCDKLWALDAYLVFKGFRRKELRLATRSWGDAFYERANAGGVLQGLVPLLRCLAQSAYFALGSVVRPLVGRN